MTWYLSGPMSGIDEHNFPAFVYAKTQMELRGHIVVSPHETDLGDAVGEWVEFLRADLIRMMRCQGIVLLRGWSKSRGSRLELSVAMALGFPVRFFNERTGELLDIT